VEIPERFLKYYHNVPDWLYDFYLVIGFVPGLDIFADAYFTAYDAQHEDWVMVAVDVGLAAMPFLGASWAKLTKKLAKGAEHVDDIPIVRNVDDIRELLTKAGGKKIIVRAGKDIDVFRAYDDVEAFLKGRSWSPIDPRSMSKMEYRELMGIGEWNRMNKVAHGIIKENTIFTIMKAIPYGSFEGKGPEILIEFDKIKYISTYTW